MTDDDSKVLEFPKMFRSDTPKGIAEALVDYVKDKPKAKMIVIINDEDGEELSMGWTPMPSSEMLLMLEFAKYKWEKRTFKDEDSLYGTS